MSTEPLKKGYCFFNMKSLDSVVSVIVALAELPLILPLYA